MRAVCSLAIAVAPPRATRRHRYRCHVEGAVVLTLTRGWDRSPMLATTALGASTRIDEQPSGRATQPSNTGYREL